MKIIEILNILSEDLKNVGIESHRLDSEILTAFVLEIERHKLIIEKDLEIDSIQLNKIKALEKRRLKYEPIAYIIGEKEFYSLDFIVNKNVLIPRPETELLVDLGIYYARQNDKVLDLGTGSGVIAVCMKYCRKDLNVTATDISSEALKVARKNSKKILGLHSIRFICGDLFYPIKDEKFNLIITNPPYVDKNIMGNLQKDLKHEPEVALFADDQGKKIINRIIVESNKFLYDHGTLLIEIGENMKDYVIKTAKENNYSITVMNDYAGLPRIGILLKNNK